MSENHLWGYEGMKSDKERIRVLLALFSLETHSRGILTVAGMLRDSGMEVIYIGNSSPEQIISAAIQENADVVGISTLCGSELVLGSELMKAAEKKEIKDKMVFVMGGIFPPANVPLLKETGFDGLFTPGATREEISGSIRGAIATKLGRHDSGKACC